jgi:hypothetical protein
MSSPAVSATSPRSSRARWYLIAAVGLVLLLLLIWWLLGRRETRPAPTRPAPAAARTADPAADAARPGRAFWLRASKPGEVKVPPAQAAGEPLIPIIDRVILEKTEVCAGEENLVTVVAHTEGNREDQYLHYHTGTMTGVAVPLRAHLPSKDQPEPEKYQVTVFGRNNVQVQVPVPYFKVLDCRPERNLFIQPRLLPNAIDEFELFARIQEVEPRSAFKPVKWIWKLGDGTTKTTSEPLVTHAFVRREQDSHYAQILIECTAVSQEGGKVMGRLPLQLMNPNFEDFAFKGIVSIRVSLTPRFPVVGDDGSVEQQGFAWHSYPGNVLVEKITRRFNYRVTDGGNPADTGSDTVSVTEILGTSMIGPEGLEIPRLRLDPSREKELFSVDYLLEGQTEDGWPAQGTFSIMRPADLPTRDQHVPVMDPELRAKILKARELLGKEYVTDEDLFRLQKLGAFQDLQVDRSQPVPTLLPATAPPKGQGTEGRPGAGSPPPGSDGMEVR